MSEYWVPGVNCPEKCPACGGEQIGPAEVVEGTATVIVWACWACEHEFVWMAPDEAKGVQGD